MADILSPQQRSERMRLIRGQDTKPELLLRRALHRLGYRYRLHDARLPGHPDLVFTSRRKIIFVHGCFWHRHAGCPKAQTPQASADFWQNKFSRTVARDAANCVTLKATGWQVLIVWECELKNLDALLPCVRAFLDSSRLDDYVSHDLK